MLKYAQKAAAYASRIQKSLEVSDEGSERHSSPPSESGDAVCEVEAPLAVDESSTDATAEPAPETQDMVIWRVNETNEPTNADEANEPTDVDEANEPQISRDAEPEVSYILRNDKVGTTYAVYGLIGQGGSGRVVKGKTTSGHGVAIKSISKWQTMQRAGTRKVLLQEMQAYRLAALLRVLPSNGRQPATVENVYLSQLLESWETDKYINFVMVRLFDSLPPITGLTRGMM